MKRPWLAALLNVVLSGLGYIYVGKRKTFGILLMISELISLIALSLNYEAAVEFASNPWILVSGVFMIVALAIDAYNEAKGISS